MTPAVAYPIPEAVQMSVMLLALLSTAVLPLYLLVLRPTGGQRTWGLSEIIAIVVLFVLTLPLAAVVIGIGLPLTLTDLSAVTLVQNLVFVGIPAYVVMSRYGLPASALGLTLAGAPRNVLLGVGLAAAALPLSIGAEHAAVYVLGLIEGPAQAAARAAMEHASDPLQPVIALIRGPLPTAWFLFLLTVIVPIGEEVFFRGFVYGGLRQRWGVVAAAVTSALFFAAVHMQVVHGLPIFVLGVLLAVLYERTRSLVPSMVAHGINNTIAVLAIWNGWNI